MQDSHAVYRAFEIWIQEFDTDLETENTGEASQIPLCKNVECEEAINLFLLHRKEFEEFRPKLLRRFKDRDFSVLFSKWFEAKRKRDDH